MSAPGGSKQAELIIRGNQQRNELDGLYKADSSFRRSELESKFLDLYSDDDYLLSKEERLLDIQIDPSSLFKVELSKPTLQLDLTFDPSTGHVSGFQEVDTEGFGDTVSSSSLQREAGSFQDFVRGSSTASPFMPGGYGKAATTGRKKRSMKNPVEIEGRLDFSEKAVNPSIPGLQFGIVYDTDGKPTIVADYETDGHSGIASTEGLDLDEFATLKGNDYYDSLYYEREEEQNRRAQKTKTAQKLAVDSEDVISGSSGSTPLASSSASLSQSSAPSLASSQQIPSLDDILSQKAPQAEDWLSAAQKSGRDILKSDWAVMDRMVNIGIDFPQLVPEMAIEFPFELDDFQKEAVYHLEESECVFIAAHTSAGKTVVAEYAIALAMKHMTRAIYTSPIKALSNQKFRDFVDVFGDVGIVTGDVSVKPDATCLIVTTEILRSMLYKGADVIRDVEWVIFDEVHYINDLERGVVWEEVIIMLPDHVNIIFLSATVPNTQEFADWVGRTKKKKVYVIKTDKRPVPLEHYLYSNKELFKIVDSKKQFLQNGYKAVTSAHREKLDKIKAKAKPGAPKVAPRPRMGPKTGKATWIKVIQMLKKKQLLPAVGFAFSRAKCLELASGLGNIDLTTSSQKSEIHAFIETSLKRLKGSDRSLPQVLQMKELLKRGIGVHHSGLLPIIKEMVEILFSRSLVKILFATETFAMGVNMPTRSVVFDSIRKHDGINFRDLLPGEYIQMSGRAGRRGLDSVGTVIILCHDEPHDVGTLHKMILGIPMKLESQFHLTYNMILNLLKMGGDFRVEDMIKRSFFESHNQKLQLKQKDRLKQGEMQLTDLEDLTCQLNLVGEDGRAPMYEYFQLKREDEDLAKKIQKFALTSTYSSQFVSPGRVVVVNNELYKSWLGVIIKVGTEQKALAAQPADGQPNKVCKVLMLTGRPSMVLADQYKITMVDAVQDISVLCKAKIKVETSLSLDQIDNDAIKKTIEQLEHLKIESAPYLPPALDPIKDMKIKDMDFMEAVMKRKKVSDALLKSPCHTCPHQSSQLTVIEGHQKLKDQVEALRYMLSEDSLLLMPEFEIRINVLRKLNYVDKDRIVQLKGRVAREITTCDELIATELIFENVLTPLAPEEVVALLSCLIFEDKSDTEPELPDRLIQAHKSLVNLAVSLANVQIENGLKLSPHEYVKSNIKWGLMQVVYEWARNMPFSEICTLTNIQEGMIVRSIVRLDETCRAFKDAARIVGDTDLAQKMEAASHMIRRDIVFASSLYLQQK